MPNQDINKAVEQASEQDRINSIQTATDSRRKRELLAIQEELENPELTHGKCPEYVFKEYFYDFFKTGTNNVTNTNLALKWLDLAGGGYNEVDVINDEGETIFTVPSIISRPTINQTVSDQVDFINLGHTIEQKNKWMRGAGDKIASETLGRTKDTILDNKSIEDDKSRWRAIFKRYETDSKEEVELTKEDKKNLEDLGLNYDD